MANFLQGLEATNLPPLQVWVAPPPITDSATAPQLFLWGARSSEKRVTFPRQTAPQVLAGMGGSGAKSIEYTLNLSMVYAISQDDATINEKFPILIDAVLARLRIIPITAELTDPTTGAQSQLIEIGERMTMNFSDPVALLDQRLLLYSARIGAECIEWILA